MTKLTSFIPFLGKLSYSTKTFDRGDYFRRNALVKSYIQQGLSPNATIISEVLDIKKPITNDHIELCKSIINNSVLLELPVPYSPYVSQFTSIVGPENTTNPDKIVSGCYKISSTKTNQSYVGHSIHLGKRIKDHAKGNDKTTGSWIKYQQPNTLQVQVYIVQGIYFLGLDLKEFLCVLEQYLFLLENPNINKVLVATAGVLHSEESFLNLRKLTGTETFVYHKTSDGLTLVHSFPSRGMVGPVFGYNRLWVKGLDRYDGSFRDTLIFSDTLDPDVNVNLLELPDLIAIHDDALVNRGRKLWVEVKVTNTITGEVFIFPNINVAAKALKADKSVFRNGRNKPYRNIYLIELVDL
jgi:GIY-YIG catalytic domain